MLTYLYFHPNGSTETLHATHAELSPDDSRLWLTHPEPIDLGGNGDAEDMFTEVGYPVGRILPVPDWRPDLATIRAEGRSIAEVIEPR